jgi:hypothetical protein
MVQGMAPRASWAISKSLDGFGSEIICNNQPQSQWCHGGFTGKVDRWEEIQNPTNHLVKMLLFWETVPIVPQSIKKMQKTPPQFIWTFWPLTRSLFKNITELVLRYFIIWVGHYKKKKKNYIHTWFSNGSIFSIGILIKLIGI